MLFFHHPGLTYMSFAIYYSHQGPGNLRLHYGSQEDLYKKMLCTVMLSLPEGVSEVYLEGDGYIARLWHEEVFNSLFHSQRKVGIRLFLPLIMKLQFLVKSCHFDKKDCKQGLSLMGSSLKSTNWNSEPRSKREMPIFYCW